MNMIQKLKQWGFEKGMMGIFSLAIVAISLNYLMTTPPTTVAGTEAIEYSFTQNGDKPEQHLISEINKATTSVDVAIYSITHPEIVKALVNKAKSGVPVRLITDKQQSAGKTQAQALKVLANAGVSIKIKSDSGLMHLKVTIIDNQEFTTGSYNYSKNASTENEEVLVIIRNEADTKQFTAQFNRMWENKKFTTFKSK